MDDVRLAGEVLAAVDVPAVDEAVDEAVDGALDGVLTVGAAGSDVDSLVVAVDEQPASTRTIASAATHAVGQRGMNLLHMLPRTKAVPHSLIRASHLE
jgi:hypothetical protein